MHQILYLSSATNKFTQEELTVLQEKSECKNSTLAVTGMLLHSDGNFIQALEGERENVLNLFNTICLDPRHHNIIKLLEKTIDGRVFSEWSMGLRSTTFKELSDTADINPFSFEKFKLKNFKHAGGPALKLLETFYNNNIKRQTL